MGWTRTLTGGVVLGVLAGCTAVPGNPVSAPEPPPPAPPAACLLDTAALAAASGVEWTPDLVTATDTRCVYDATGGFLAVDLAPGDDLETQAALCDDGSRTDVASGGLVCRFGAGVFAAAVVDGPAVLTIAAAEAPTGTDATRLVTAFGDQLTALGGG